MPASFRQTPPQPPGAAPGMLRAAGTVGLLTLLSRLFGYLRDVVVAGLLGTGLVADAWQAAFEVPNMLRRLASEGNLSAAAVPVLAHVRAARGEGAESRLADRFHSVVAVGAAALTVLGILVAPWIVPLLYPGFVSDPGKVELTVRLTRLVFAYALFISLSAVLMAVLNARERFAAAAFTPVLLNLAILGCGVGAWVGGAPEPVYFILAGAVLGGALQWLFLVPFARSAGMTFQPRVDWHDPDLREIGRLIGPRLLGVGVVQVNILVGRMLASGLGEGNVAALYFGSRITELALGIFAISIATVVLPPLSRQGAAGDHAGMRTTLSTALRQVTVVTAPATVALVVLREPIVRVLFERGRFDEASTAITAAGLAGYAVGLVGVAAARVSAPGFFALRDTRTPLRIALVAMVINVAGCLLLRGPLQIAGISLANSLAALFSAGALLLLLRSRLGGIDGGGLMRALLRIAVASALMGVVVSYAAPLLVPSDAAAAAAALGLLVLVTLGVAVYGGVLMLVGGDELREVAAVLRRRADARSGRRREEEPGSEDK